MSVLVQPPGSTKIALLLNFEGKLHHLHLYPRKKDIRRLHRLKHDISDFALRDCPDLMQADQFPGTSELIEMQGGYNGTGVSTNHGVPVQIQSNSWKQRLAA